MSRPKGLPKTGGRKKGVPNKRTRDFNAAVADAGSSPLEYMIAVMRDPAVDPERRDRMAVAAAPFIHARLASIEAKVEGVGPMIIEMVNYAGEQPAPSVTAGAPRLVASSPEKSTVEHHPVDDDGDGASG